MKRSRYVIWAAATLMGFSLLGCMVEPSHAPTRELETVPGAAAPEMQAAFVTGEGPRTIAESRGRVVIVDFWSTYCDPCERSFPRYQSLQQRYGNAVAIIAVSLDSPTDVNAGALERFAKRTGVRFPIVWDKEGATRRAYGPPNLPTSFIIDPQGKVAFIHRDYEAGDIETMEREVDRLLARPVGATASPR